MIQIDIEKQPYPKKGILLLSEPFLKDENFTRSVILLCEHNEEGSFGFILNSTLDLKLHEVIQDFPDSPVRLGIGGPVEKNQLYYIHGNKELKDSIEIVPGVYMGGNFNDLCEAFQKKEICETEMRFFIGYSGWSMNQLAAELEIKSWIVISVPEEFNLFDTNDENLWSDLIRTKGPKYQIMSQFPINPADN